MAVSLRFYRPVVLTELSPVNSTKAICSAVMDLHADGRWVEKNDVDRAIRDAHEQGLQKGRSEINGHTGIIAKTQAEYDKIYLNLLREEVHKANRKWWLDLNRAKICSLCGEEEGQPSTSGHCYHANRTSSKHDFQHPLLSNPNIGEKLMLIVSEISEAMEGHRKNLQDDKLPHRSMIEVELVDALIRIFDLAGYLKLDLGGAYVEKMAYNAQREDHKVENRLKEGGKKY